jgi:hypothetical protein
MGRKKYDGEFLENGLGRYSFFSITVGDHVLNRTAQMGYSGAHTKG